MNRYLFQQLQTDYYVVIDTWPSPNCVPSFDLSISEAIDGCTDPLATIIMLKLITMMVRVFTLHV